MVECAGYAARIEQLALGCGSGVTRAAAHPSYWSTLQSDNPMNTENRNNRVQFMLL